MTCVSGRAAAFIAALVLAGCGSVSTPTGTAPTSPAAQAQVDKENPDARGTRADDRGRDGPNEHNPDIAPEERRDGSDDDGPPPADLPWTPDPSVRADAVLTPVCIERGGRMTLELHTEPEAGVAYQAVYADGRGGAQEPYGGGYGGNDKGMAEPDGSFSSAWLVSPSAPVGRARVDVIIGYDGRWGYAGPEFRVAPAGGC